VVVGDRGDLFEAAGRREAASRAPLAERMRPHSFEELAGQRHLLAPGRPLRAALERDRVPSMILWGPPGSGKTTFAGLVAARTGARFERLSAVAAGVADLRRAVEAAREARDLKGRPTILFIDEIHRFNKAQQDFLLPHVESGLVTLIGATTENPSFEVIGALLSRSRVFVFKPLQDDEIAGLVARAASDAERGLAGRYELTEDVRDLIARTADGDARRALTVLEACADALGDRGEITPALVQDVVGRVGAAFDKGGENFYNLISALHKSIRASDPDAALYWLARMLAGGAEPLYLARRLVRAAVEDVGLADPGAITAAIAARDVVDFLGSPEGDLALAQAAVHLALAPKSNSIYRAYGLALQDVEGQPSYPVPMHIRNAPTRLMKELGYGAGYAYYHAEPDASFAAEYRPGEVAGHVYYDAGGEGWEQEWLRTRLAELRRSRAGARRGKGEPE
jgi:putative ATPase